ncbi:MAG: sugar phosphate nucleotidyltransferase [bacterium]|jgi:NDP-sugar pyrophosphorylase family protein/aminoglycoside/choline kinase family phosphotransferase
MNKPRKAIILAAGFGSRLLPLTLLKPKPLFPIWGQPVLGHTLQLLQRWGVKEVLVNAHHHADQILAYLQTIPVPGMKYHVSFEPNVLGTGGVLPKARWFLDDQPFWMINADVMAELDELPLIKAFHQHAAIASLWLHPERGPRTVEHKNGLISVFKSPLAKTEGTATFCGLQLLSPGILKYLPESGFASIVDAYENALVADEKIAGVVVPNAYWADIGNPESYLAAHREMLELPRWKSFRSRDGRIVASGIGTTIHPKAKVDRSVLWDHVTLLPGANVQDAIITDGVTLSSRASYMAIPAADLPDAVISRVLNQLDWNPNATTVLPLPPRGSARTFTRLISGSQEKSKSAMVVRYSLERPENGLYTSQARFLLKQGISVPGVLLDWPKEQLCVLEDVGENSLEQLMPNLDRAHCIEFYKQTLDNVACLHTQATRAAARHPLKLSMPFTRHLYEWEQSLFCDQFLRRHLPINEDQCKLIRKELAGLIPAQVRAPRVIVHRDLQSSNVLINTGKVFLIDFQGMRMGTAAYDLASLLCDPYVNLPADVRDELLEYYLGLIPNGKPVRDLFWIAAVERLSQALGAFGRLGAAPATSYFLKHIPAGINQLQKALLHIPGLPTLKSGLNARG